MRHFLFSRALLVAGLLLPLAAPGAESPRWIWSGASSAKPDEARYFRKVFTVNAASPAGILKVAASGEADVFLNGKELAKGVGLKSPLVKDVSSSLKKGKNVLAIRARNSASEPAGVVAVLEMKRNPKARKVVSTDDSWQSSDEASDGWQSAARFEASGWSAAHAVGTLGDKPWGDVFPLPSATDPSTLTVLPGFKVELLHSATQTEGSWICMTTDQKGRFIISPQADNQPLLRVTIKHGKVSRIEPIQAPIHQAMGLLYAYDSLYASGHGPEGTGLYRLIDANHDDQFETNELHFLSRILGEGEHGYHALMLGPDKKIYMMNGNHTKLPPLDPLSPHKNYQEDLLLPRQWDANGHAVGILAPGGQIFQTDENGKDFKLMLAGFRNSYDFDFNPDGEIFTFDSDMEWDWGLPWYRPTRVCHAITGAEFGWRSGSAKMPAYYPDTLPSTLKIGIGSPTGVKFGTGSDFPEKYRTALFILDWSYGRIFAVHLKPHGASYSADAEVFLRGKPLNLTALRFGKDGSMYFITGGRGTQSGLYRVSYVGKRDPWWHHSPRTKEDRQAAAARAVRHKLESFYARKDPAAIDFAWPYLGSHDRFLSYAARIAIEWQDVNLWKDRALREVNPDAALTGLLALARCGGKDTQRPLLEALNKFPMDSLSITQKLDKLRVIELSFTRQGRPDAGLASMETKQLDSLYPSQNEYMNRELCQLLI
ncbi:MAG TPA: heme-binding protein, partial [Verrucomicrobiae bacterium]|nr:heme-binding protein [Verrucomicrobiae bacterium]